MSFGFTTTNDNNNILIDDTYKNLVLVQKGVCNSTSGSTNNGGLGDYNNDGFGVSNYFINVYGVTNPIFAANCSTYPITVVPNGKLGDGGYQFSMYIGTSNSDKPVVNWYCFDTITTTSTTGWGIVVNDGSGNPTYDYAQKYLRVVGQGSSIDGTYTSGHTYATCAIKVPMQMVVTYDGSIGYIQTYQSSGYQTNGATVTAGAVKLLVTHPGTPLTNYSQSGEFMLIDVTGY